MNLFLASVRYTKQLDNGGVKQVTEQFLLDALTYTEAEARITDEVLSFTAAPDIVITSIVKPKITEMFKLDAPDTKWYRVKINFTIEDERTGSEKKSASTILVEAIDFDDAYKQFLKGMKGTIADYEIASITETAIVDYFPYNGNGSE